MLTPGGPLHSTANPGYFNREIFKAACASIGMKPLCNHESYCDSDSVRVSGAYLTQCDDGALGSDAQCAGLPYEAVHNAVMYNTAGWNGDTFLARISGSHAWRSFNSPQGSYTETLCA